MGTLAILVLGGAVSAASVFVVVALARRGHPTVGPDTGAQVFRYSRRLRVTSCAVALGFQVPVAAMVVLHPPTDAGEAASAALLHAMFAALGGALVWDVLRFRLVVGPDGLDCRSPWRCHRVIRWAGVVDVSFNGPAGWFEVRAVDGATVRLPALVGGLGEFLAACERHLAPHQLEPARAAYAFLGRPFPGEGDR